MNDQTVTYRVRMLDLETTGFPPDAGVCEVAYRDALLVTADSGLLVDLKLEGTRPRSTLLNPGRPIPAMASAVHHIVDKDIVAAPPASEVLPRVMAASSVGLFLAHNAKFEQHFLAELDPDMRPWLCTYKIALRMFPELGSHSNQAIRYALNLSIVPPESAMPPHRAGPDIVVTGAIFAKMIEEATDRGHSLNDLLDWSEQPALLSKVSFGKNKGKRWSDVDPDYLEWVAFKAEEADEDARFTARHHLDRR